MARRERDAAVMLLGLCCCPSQAQASEPRLDITDCPSLDPTVTEGLFAIELRTLGVALSSTLVVSVRCHRQHATLRLLAREVSKPSHDLANMELDLSTTDEAAWPRLLALSASELVEQSIRREPAAARGERTSTARMSFVSLSVKPTKKPRHLPSLGLALSRVGAPETWLTGLTLGTDLRLGEVGLVGVDLRGDWGNTTLAAASVSWQHVTVAAFGGFAMRIGLVEACAFSGMRVGRLALSGEAKLADASGRRLVGPTGGPLVALRLRAPVGHGIFAGVTLEEGYHFWPVRGRYDQSAPLLDVDGSWTSISAQVGWAF